MVVILNNTDISDSAVASQIKYFGQQFTLNNAWKISDITVRAGKAVGGATMACRVKFYDSDLDLLYTTSYGSSVDVEFSNFKLSVGNTVFQPGTYYFFVEHDQTYNTSNAGDFQCCVSAQGDLNTGKSYQGILGSTLSSENIGSSDDVYFLLEGSYDFAGGDGTSGSPYQIENWNHLNNIRYNLDKVFILNNNLMSSSLGYSLLAGSSANNGSGWDPIDNLTGFFNGNNKIIYNLYINRSEDNIGLFGELSAGSITDVGVEGTIVGNSRTGILNGYNNQGTIKRSFSSGKVTGTYRVGGLIGQNGHSFQAPANNGLIENCYSIATVVNTGFEEGGLIGKNLANIDDSYCIGIVSGTGESDGFGYSEESIITNCFYDSGLCARFDPDNGATATSTTGMKSLSTFSGAGWDIADMKNASGEVWLIDQL